MAGNKHDFKPEDFFLRFAITADCNFRCDYCNPEGLKAEGEQLTEDEIMQIVEAGRDAGVRKIHWTGGEPTIRNMQRLISETKGLGYDDQVITTNGSRGGDHVEMMAEAGLDRLIVSLDTLDRQQFIDITKRDKLEEVIDTARTATRVLSQPTKMNVVYTRENANQMRDFVELSRDINGNPDNKGSLVVKFLELTEMNPVFSEEGLARFGERHTTKDAMMKELAQYGTLVPTKTTGNNPSTHYFRIPEQGDIVMGMINIPSEGYRCGGDGCAKIRLNSYGSIAVCVNQAPVNMKGKSLQRQTQIIEDLIGYRSMINTFYPGRQHKQGGNNFGFWRFGDTSSGDKKWYYKKPTIL